MPNSLFALAGTTSIGGRRMMLFWPEIERERELIKALRYHVNKLDELERVYKVAIWNEQYRYMRKVERICGEG